MLEATGSITAVNPKLSLIVSTFGRSAVLGRVLESLDRQTFRDFEVIVVDQNVDDRTLPLINRLWNFELSHLRCPGVRGISAGRNVGWRAARGGIVLFPDDDCWYPSGFLTEGLRRFEASGAQLLSGRAAAEDGRSINGRYARTARAITPINVWICQMEWVTFIDRAWIDRIGGFDEGIGIGSASPWQAAEGPDLILRALAKGEACFFDPELCGHHEEIETRAPEPPTVRKLYDYARGMGFVLRRHGAGLPAIAYWAARPMFNALRYALVGQFARARCYLSVARGRVEGYTSGDSRRANS